MLWKRWRKNEKRNDNFLMEIVLKKWLFSKRSFLKTIVSLTIVNEERRREEIDLKGIRTYHWVVSKKISRSFSSPKNFFLHVRKQQPFVNDRKGRLLFTISDLDLRKDWTTYWWIWDWRVLGLKTSIKFIHLMSS